MHLPFNLSFLTAGEMAIRNHHSALHRPAERPLDDPSEANGRRDRPERGRRVMAIVQPRLAGVADPGFFDDSTWYRVHLPLMMGCGAIASAVLRLPDLAWRMVRARAA
jgi:hypothetical protein